MATEECDNLRSQRSYHSTFPKSDEFDFEFSPFEDENNVRINPEYIWLLETELPQTLQDIGKLLAKCQRQLKQNSSNVEQRALLIPEQSNDYVSGTLYLEGDKIPRADIFIKPSPKSSNKSRFSVKIIGVSNSWKLDQITDASNQLEQVIQKFSHLLHRQDLQRLSSRDLAFLISDIIDSLHVLLNIFSFPKRPKLKDIQLEKVSFKPPLPDDIMINIFFSSFYLVITIFYLSNAPHRNQIQNSKPIISISQQESLINSVLDGVPGKELEVIFQGEGVCAVPHVKYLLNYVRICLLHCQALWDQISCFVDIEC